MRSTLATLLLLALPAAGWAQILRDPAVKTFTAIPAGNPPAPLTANPGTTSIYLRWGCPDGASGYDVYVTPAGGVQAKLTPAPIPAQCVQDIQKTQLAYSTTATYSLGFTHNGVVPGVSYTYVVVALYPTGAQGASTPVGVQAKLLPGPSVTAVPTAARNAVISWGSLSGATAYQMYRKLADQASFQYVALAGNTTTSWTDPTILPGGQHQYVVQAVNGLQSAPVTVTLPNLAAPSGLGAQDFGAYIRLTWDPLPGATGYHVFRQLQGEASFSQVTTTPIAAMWGPTVFIGPELKDQPPRGQRVSYYVKAVGGDPAAPVSVVPGIPRWSQIRTFPGSNNIYFNWGGSYLPTTEKVFRAPVPAGPWAEVQGTSYFNGEAHVPGNPFEVTQYFKVWTLYPTGAAESLVIGVRTRQEPKGETCYGSVSDKGVVTWNYQFCY